MLSRRAPCATAHAPHGYPRYCREFSAEQVIKAVAEGKQSLPSDPSKRAVYKAQLERFEQKQERKQGGADAAVAPGEAWLTDDERARRREERLYADLRAEQILDLPPDQRMREILKMPPEDQRALAASLKGDKRDEFLEGMDAKQRETLMALNNPQQVVVDELVQAKLLRAIYSERQLQEVMTDFLVQPLQRIHRQRRRPLSDDQLRA